MQAQPSQSPYGAKKVMRVHHPFIHVVPVVVKSEDGDINLPLLGSLSLGIQWRDIKVPT